VVGEISTATKLVSIDNYTFWEVLEYARLKVRVQNFGSVRMARRVRINKHVCSIFIEEEAIGCEGQGCNDNLYVDDSTDSVSSLETYVEDTDFSEKNGEEKGRCRVWDECWPDGGEGGRKDGGDGEQYMPKSNIRFEGSTSKSKGCQAKGDSSFTNVERLGQKANVCVSLPAPDCDRARYSNPNLADLAKVVVDIECLSNQKVIYEALGRVCKSEAQLQGGGPHGSTQKNEGYEGLVIQSTIEGLETGESHSDGGKMIRRQLEGSEVSDSIEAWQAHSESLGSKIANETQYGMSREEGGQQKYIVLC